MQGLLSQMIGRHVTVEQANSEQVSGKLVHVQSDYLAIHDQNRRFVYIQIGHIISVVVNHAELVLPLDDVEAEGLPSFVELLRSLSGQIIHIDVGNHANDGVVYQVNNEEISLILDMKHTIYYPIRQIPRFSLVLIPNKSSKTNEKSEGNTEDVLSEQKAPEAKSREQERQEKDLTMPSSPTVIQDEHDGLSNLDGLDELDELDEDVMDYSTREAEPMLVAYMQKEITQKPQKRNRHSEHASSSNLTIFYSQNKHLGSGLNAIRRKLS